MPGDHLRTMPSGWSYDHSQIGSPGMNSHAADDSDKEEESSEDNRMAAAAMLRDPPLPTRTNAEGKRRSGWRWNRKVSKKKI